MTSWHISRQLIIVFWMMHGKLSWSTRHAINITGGTEKVRYFIGGSYFYNVGSFDNLKYSKYNFELVLTLMSVRILQLV